MFVPPPNKINKVLVKHRNIKGNFMTVIVHTNNFKRNLLYVRPSSIEISKTPLSIHSQNPKNGLKSLCWFEKYSVKSTCKCSNSLNFGFTELLLKNGKRSKIKQSSSLYFYGKWVLVQSVEILGFSIFQIWCEIKVAIFCYFRGSEFCSFGELQPSKSAKIHNIQNS